MGLADEMPLALRRERRSSTKLPHTTEDATLKSPRHSTRTRRLTTKAALAPVSTSNTPTKSNTSSSHRRRSEHVSAAVRVAKTTAPPSAARPTAASRARNAHRTAPTSGSGRSSTKRQKPTSEPRCRRRRRSSMPVRAESEPLSGVFHFKPLRAVIEERMLRRIRRNGLSEEMNTIDAENRKRKRLLRQQLADLKKELESRDAEIENMRNMSLLSASQAEEHDAAREQVLQLQRQIADLKEELNRSNMTTPVDSSSFPDWSQMSHYRNDDETLSVVTSQSGGVDSQSQSSQNHYEDETMAIDHGSNDDDDDDHHMHDDEEFGDDTIQDLEHCGTPTRSVKKPEVPLRHNMLTPPTTSPTGVPSVSRQQPVNAAIMAAHEQLIDHAAELEQEVSTLRAQADEAELELELYSKFMKNIQTRLGDYRVDLDMNSIKSSITSSLDALEANLDSRRATLENLTKALRGLGFAGSNPDDIVKAIHDTFQSARTEISFLPPHNVDLPETANPAEIFDMALTQLRDLSRRVREDEEIIDQAHETENQLRQQLSDRSASGAVDHKRLAEAHNDIANQHTTILNLEKELNTLRSDMSGRTSEIDTLQRRVMRLEHEGTSARNALAQRDASIAELEENLSGLIHETEALRADLQAAHTAHCQRLAELMDEQAADLATMEDKHSKKMAAVHEKRTAEVVARDQQIAQLGAEILRLTEELAEAHATIASLREENTGLETDLEDQRVQANTMIETVREDLQNALIRSQRFLLAPRERKSASVAAPVVPAQQQQKRMSAPKVITAAQKAGPNQIYSGLQREGAYLPKTMPAPMTVDMPTSDSAIAFDADDTLVMEE